MWDICLCRSGLTGFYFCSHFQVFSVECVPAENSTASTGCGKSNSSIGKPEYYH